MVPTSSAPHEVTTATMATATATATATHAQRRQTVMLLVLAFVAGFGVGSTESASCRAGESERLASPPAALSRVVETGSLGDIRARCDVDESVLLLRKQVSDMQFEVESLERKLHECAESGVQGALDLARASSALSGSGPGAASRPGR